MERVSVSGEGVEVHRENPPLVSMYGKQMRAGVAWTEKLAWPEIAEISLDVWRLPPDGSRHIALGIGLTWGEFISVGQDAEGFAEAVAAIAAWAGSPQPDLSALDGSAVLWVAC